MLRTLMLTSGLVAISAAALAQELPGTEALKAMLAESLPGYWETDDLVVVATSNLGDAGRPRALIRFEVEAVPRDDLFLETGSQGPFALVVSTHGKNEVRRLYGVFDLSYSAGVWSGGVTIENPVAELGQPLDLFSRPTLAIGAPETEAQLAALRDTALQSVIDAHESELAQLRADHSQAMVELEIEHASNMSALRTAQAAERIKAEETFAGETAAALRAAREASEAELEALRIDHAERRASLMAQQEAEIAELTASDGERTRRLDEARRATAAALREVEDEFSAELEALQAEHAQARGELIARQRQELAEIETRLATERRSLERQIEAATDVVALQQSLAVALEQRDALSASMIETFEQASSARRAIFSRLPKIMGGNIVCTEDGGMKRQWANGFQIAITEARANGFSAKILEGEKNVYNRRDVDFVSKMPDVVFPLELEVGVKSADGLSWSELRLIELQIDANGLVTGGGSTTWSLEGQQVPVTCTITATG